MKITGLALWRVKLKSFDTYYMSDGKVCDVVDSMVLRLDTDSGLSGWGEVCPIPHYLPAYADGVAPALAEMASSLIGRDPIGPEAAMGALEAHLPDHRYAKSAIDVALWDLTAKAANMPLYRLLGGRRAADMPVYVSLTCVAPEEMARMAREAQAGGVRQFQAKLGADDDWEADVARLRRVREVVGPGPLVYGDWNCGATRLTATRVGRAVRDLDVMLEQPCATLEECAAVRQATGLAMKIDEGAHDAATLLKAHALGCLDAVAVKTSKFGGLSAARRARDLCVHLGAMMCVEDTWGTCVARAAALHLAAASPPKSVLNVCDFAALAEPRLDPAGPMQKDGRLAPPEGVGLGVAPDPALLTDCVMRLGDGPAAAHAAA